MNLDDVFHDYVLWLLELSKMEMWFVLSRQSSEQQKIPLNVLESKLIL